ncbi:hypothetical protein DFH28DRAFT_1133663 [Melampsora americana]|nr:hypothetical protein DFH28DRAFT_1133663 [Melampsora americana]
MIAPERAVRFVWPTEYNDDFDVTGLFSMVCAGVSLMLKNTTLAWVGLMFSITAIFNHESDRRSPGSQASNPYQGVLFSVLALTTSYVQKLVDPNARLRVPPPS